MELVAVVVEPIGGEWVVPVVMTASVNYHCPGDRNLKKKRRTAVDLKMLPATWTWTTGD